MRIIYTTLYFALNAFLKNAEILLIAFSSIKRAADVIAFFADEIIFLSVFFAAFFGFGEAFLFSAAFVI